MPLTVLLRKAESEYDSTDLPQPQPQPEPERHTFQLYCAETVSRPLPITSIRDPVHTDNAHFGESLGLIERRETEASLKRNGWVQIRAARELGQTQRRQAATSKNMD